MTDRHAGYLVSLDRDIREDDAEAIVAALRLLRGVVNVQPVPADITQAISTDRARSELRLKLWQALEEDR